MTGEGPTTDDGRVPGGPEDATRAVEALVRAQPLLVALDFDGVCAPLVDDPAASRMLPGTREALLGLQRAGARVALVSGRGLASLREVARPEPGWLLVGGHGAEPAVEPGDDDRSRGTSGRAGRATDVDTDAGTEEGQPGATAGVRLSEDESRVLGAITADLDEIVAAHPGTSDEHKPTAVVLHVRRADTDTARAATEAALAGPGARTGVHVKRGHHVVELAVREADKGTALRVLREQTGARAVLYVGDDVTDEDAFAVLEPERGDVGVKVGDGDTAAQHRVGTPTDVTVLLDRLLERLR